MRETGIEREKRSMKHPYNIKLQVKQEKYLH